MILSSFLAALGQLSDRRFLRVAALGIALSLALLVGFSAGAVWLIAGASPESLTLPLVGEVRWVGDLLGWGAALLMAGLSVFLMVPVASACSWKTSPMRSRRATTLPCPRLHACRFGKPSWAASISWAW